MRKYILIFCLVFAFSEESAFSQTKHMRIGVLTPLSGGPAEQGTWILHGAELARDLVKGEGITVQLEIEDTQGDPKQAVSALQKLLAQGQLDAILTYGSGVGVALSSLCNQQKIIQMGVATSTPAYRSAEDFTFRNFPSAELEAEFLVQQAKKIESSPNVTVVRINNEFGLGTAKAFTQALEKLGGKVNAEEILEPSGSDYRAIITRMRAHPGNLVYLGVYPNEGAVFLRQAKELGLKGPFLSSVAILGAKNFFQLVGEGTKDLYVASSTPAFIESDSTEMKEFVSRYREKFGAEPSVEQIYAARSYDGLRAIATAQKSCGEHEADCLKDALFLVHDLKGPSGSIRFDRNGDVTSTFSLLKVNGNSFELVR